MAAPATGRNSLWQRVVRLENDPVRPVPILRGLNIAKVLDLFRANVREHCKGATQPMRVYELF